jgi:lipoprotein-anchoring transpeptidase ErfK/SrfK
MQRIDEGGLGRGLMLASAVAAGVLAIAAIGHEQVEQNAVLSAPVPPRVWSIAVPVEAFQKSAVRSGVASKAGVPKHVVSPRAISSTSVRRIVVSIPDRKLALVEDGRVVKIYVVAVGAKVSPSPTGAFKIVTRIPQATYYHPAVVIPAGEDSPIGTRWIGLNRAGYGIHGTNAPRSIGKAASHGCIRMRNRDAEEFFELVRVGDAVEIRGERDGEVAELFHDRNVRDAAASGIQ